MATTTPNFGWAVPTSTDLVKDGAVAIETLGDAIDASLADLKGGTTGQVLKKNSNTDMDFVWSADSAGMTNPMTITGDTIYSSSGSTPARLGIGSTGQVLTVSGGVPTWATPTGGGKFAQIVQADYTGQTTITSTTFVTTNLTATITPTATTSKVLIQVTIPFYGPGGGQEMDLAIYRGTVGAGTNLSPSNFLAWGTRAEIQSAAMLFLDSPATASAQVYTVAAKVAGGTGYTINSPSRGVITLTEVLA